MASTPDGAAPLLDLEVPDLKERLANVLSRCGDDVVPQLERDGILKEVRALMERDTAATEAMMSDREKLAAADRKVRSAERRATAAALDAALEKDAARSADRKARSATRRATAAALDAALEKEAAMSADRKAESAERKARAGALFEEGAAAVDAEAVAAATRKAESAERRMRDARRGEERAKVAAADAEARASESERAHLDVQNRMKQGLLDMQKRQAEVQSVLDGARAPPASDKPRRGVRRGGRLRVRGGRLSRGGRP